VSIKTMNWVDLSIWVNSYRELLRDSVIDNIYSFKDALVLRLRLRDGGKKLLVSRPGQFIFLSPENIIDKKDLVSRDSFINHLRRIIRDCRITDITQQPCERIIDLMILCGDEKYILTLELIPRGVFVLRDSSNIIKALNKSLKTRDRVLKINSQYKYPPKTTNLYCEDDTSKILSSFRKGYDIVRGLVVGLGVPSDIAEEFIYRNNIDKSTDPKKLGDEEAMKIIDRLKRFLSELIQKPKPCIILGENNNVLEYYSYQPLSKGDVCVVESDFNDVLREYYLPRIKFFAETDLELSEFTRLKDQFIKDLEKISLDHQNLIKIKNFIDQNYYALENIFICYRESMRSRNREIACPSRDDLGCVYSVDKNILRISCGELLFEFDLMRDFRENYVEISKKISQLERGIEKIKENLNNLEKKILERRAELEKQRLVSEIRMRRRVEWFERFHWIITSEGFLAIGGRDIDQNETLVRKYLERDDLFFHADIHGGSVFILKKGTGAGEKSIIETAHLAGCYSKAWSAGYGSIDVFYVSGDQVSKTPPSGEYLPKGSFMIYGEKKWVRGVKMILGIGIEMVDSKYPRVIVGDPDYVRSRSSIYAIITPGNDSSREVAEKIVKKWLEKHREQEIFIRSLELDEVIRKIPGKSKIIFI